MTSRTTGIVPRARGLGFFTLTLRPMSRPQRNGEFGPASCPMTDGLHSESPLAESMFPVYLPIVVRPIHPLQEVAPMPKITLNNVTVSDAYMALLADRGIDYWFANAGTDFAPVVETLAKAEVLETKVPKPVTCPHENTAMHMAIGYFLVTGKPQAVMVHVNVGTANGMNGLLNAARGHVPVLFTAGSHADERRRPGGPSQPRHSLDPGDVRSGGNAARIGQMGL